MIRFLALCAVALFPAFALADPILVRSGEHPGFSRLVIDFQGVPEWTFGRVDGGYELRPDHDDAIYDLDDVFRLIPRDRLETVEQRADGTLFLGVACDCYADVFELRGNLVLDVKDGPPTQDARYETSLADRSMNEPENDNVTANVAMPDPRPPRIVPPPLATADTGNDMPFQYVPRRSEIAWQDNLALSLPSMPPLDSARHSQPSGAIAERRAAAQATLIEQLGRAAAQGLVTPDLSATETLLEQSRPRATPDSAAESAVPVEMPDPMGGPDIQKATDSPNIRFETAIDRGELRTQSPPSLSAEGDTCLPSTLFDLTNWGTPPDHGSAISDYRSKIVGEFDVANPASVEALVKHYIYLTFGAEARALLAAFDTEISNAPLLATLADIMDDGVATTPFLLKDQVECDTNVALWAVMARPSLSKADKISRETVIGAFAALPLHLRRHLGPGLAARFLQIGDTETAATIRNTISRAPGDHGSGFDMMEAEIALELGAQRAGTDQLAEIIREDGPQAQNAVIRLIDTQVDAGTRVAPSLITTASAMAFEARGSELGAELQRVRFRAMANAGQILETLTGIGSAEEQNRISAGVAASLRREAFQLSVDNAPDVAFLQATLALPLELGNDDMADSLRRRIADRLISLGMPEPARAVLSEDTQIPTPEDRVLYARSFLDENRADLAIGYLAGLNDPTALELRARAHVQALEFDRAAKTYADLGKVQEQARAVWRGQDWEAARELGSDAERAAVRVATGPASETGTDAAAPGSLAYGEGLLDRSRQTRLVLTTLLSETTSP